MNTLIPDVKEKFWDYILKFLEGDSSHREFLLTKEGHSILDVMHKDEKINKYQWYYYSGTYPRDLLFQYIIPNFLFPIKFYTENINLKGNFSESDDLKNYFDAQFEKLENEVLLSDYFDYLILIPIYRVLLPSGIKEIEFDSDHRLKNIAYQEAPYGQWNFSAFPQFWDKEQERAANASFEACLSIKKRLVSEDPYNEENNPIDHYSILKNDAFNQKIQSIFDFFLLFSPLTQLGTLTIGDKCFIAKPPFFQQYSYLLEKSLSFEFSPPYTFLELNLSEGHPQYFNWVELWKKNYSDFYNIFYQDTITKEHNDIFLYTLEVLRTFMNIPYNRIQCFLLISTFESILYHKDIFKKLNSQKSKYSLTEDITKHNKKIPCIKAFLEICEDQKEYWQGIFQHEFPLKVPIKKFKSKNDIEYFLNLSFIYRNNIAHPENIKEIKIEEKYLYEPCPPEEIWVLIHFIKFEFPFFLKFLLRTWLKNGYKKKAEWYDYILNLL